MRGMSQCPWNDSHSEKGELGMDGSDGGRSGAGVAGLAEGIAVNGRPGVETVTDDPWPVESLRNGQSYVKCPVCSTCRPDGAWTDTNLSHCRHCHRTWGRNTKQAHCATCHEHFTTPGNFDAHLAPVAWQGHPCRPPGAVVSKAGEPKLRLRDDGVWCGAGEYDREAVA